jgi:TonB family protein
LLAGVVLILVRRRKKLSELALLALALFPLALSTAVGAQGSQPYRPGNGVSAPKLIKEVKPNYTPEARAAKIQGTVLLSTVVREDGSVSDVKVSRSLDTKYGLDEEAIKAAKQWMFAPGMRDGKPVPVIVTIELYFQLSR